MPRQGGHPSVHELAKATGIAGKTCEFCHDSAKAFQ
jgi:hypothetical protein